MFNEPSPRPTHINLHKGQYTKYQTGIFWLTGLFLPKLLPPTWPCLSCLVTLRTNLCQGKDKIELPRHSISSLTSVPIQAETWPPRNTISTFYIYTVHLTVERWTSYNGLKDFIIMHCIGMWTFMQFNFLGQRTQRFITHAKDSSFK